MKKKVKPTILETVNKILESDLPLSTRNSIVRYYLLPQLGRTQAIIEGGKIDVGTVTRPDYDEVETENNPRLKAEYKDTEKLMGVKDEDD